MMIDTFVLDATSELWKYQLLEMRQNLVRYVRLSSSINIRILCEYCALELTMTRSITARQNFPANL